MTGPEEIEAQKTASGGWTRMALAAWGIPWPPPKGWRRWVESGDVLGGDWEERLPPVGYTPLVCQTCSIGFARRKGYDGPDGHEEHSVALLAIVGFNAHLVSMPDDEGATE
jgi:hypothetical protein